MSEPTLPIVEKLRRLVIMDEVGSDNPLGRDAADTITALVEALEESQDKLWVIHFGLKDAAEREAAINACNMASAALTKARSA